MRTLHFGLRVADIDRSLAFYRAVGYEIVGRVAETPLGPLTMLKLPADEFVTIELVHDPAHAPTQSGRSLNHFVIQVDDLDTTVVELASRGIQVPRAEARHDPDAVRTAWIADPDGNRIELVQWPTGHADGMSAADFGVPPTT